MELYIFNRDLALIGIIDEFTSLQWTRRYYKAGEFELQCALTADAINLLQRENIIWKQGDDEAGYIEYRDLKQDENGQEILDIKGKLLTGYLNRRIIWGTEILMDTAENAMLTLVDHNCIHPTDTSRIIPNLTLGALKSFTKEVNYQVSYSNLSDELKNLSSLSDLGYRVKFDAANKKIIFDVFQGLDRTASQSINAPAIFSKEFENVLEQEFTDSLNNYKNLALVGGMGEGTERKLVTVGVSSGLDRFELFVDARDTTNTVDNSDGSTTTLDAADYTDILTYKGNTELAQYTDVKTFDSKININSNLTYKTDFDLGDMVTCASKKWGITLDTKITEILEVYEEHGTSVSVIFGNNVPTLIDKIKQKLR